MNLRFDSSLRYVFQRFAAMLSSVIFDFILFAVTLVCVFRRLLFKRRSSCIWCVYTNIEEGPEPWVWMGSWYFRVVFIWIFPALSFSMCMTVMSIRTNRTIVKLLLFSSMHVLEYTILTFVRYSVLYYWITLSITKWTIRMVSVADYFSPQAFQKHTILRTRSLQRV